MHKKSSNFDLIVIGSGIGGNVAAQLASGFGKKVAIVEESLFGGECSNWGCVPSKTLLSVAHVYDTAKQGDRLGLRSSTISYNYPSIRTWKNQVLRTSGLTESKARLESKGIKVITGHAEFVDPKTIVVDKQQLKAKNFVISTGSKLIWPEIDGLNRVKFLTHRDAVDMSSVPKSIAIIGGGATGCEFAELFSIFGSKVYLLEADSRLLPRMDKDISEVLTTVFERDRKISVLTDTKVVKARQVGSKKEIYFKVGEDEQSIKVDDIMIATGKSPNVNLGLDNAKVKFTKLGIKTDRTGQTSRSNIYAIGDCTGVSHYTHIATMQAKVAIHNIFKRQKVNLPNSPIPHVVFTSPEIATIGLTSDNIRRTRQKIKVLTTSIKATPRAHIEQQFDGFLKMIVDTKTKQLIGASIVSPNATEIIHELSLVMYMKMPIDQLQNVYHAFPTWSELVQITAQKY